MSEYFIGFDVGSSSVKTSILDVSTGQCIGRATFPETEQPISSPQTGWAEQDPEMWWRHAEAGYTAIVAEHSLDTKKIQGIGIAYQMHGLVALDENGHVLRPSIIWCDSRAVPIGESAYNALGATACLPRLLNSPGNFTAAKLGWVKEHEPEVYERIHRIMLPGDYIAYRLTGDMTTTPGGLSEGILWDFESRSVANQVLDSMDLDAGLIPDLVPNMGKQGTVQSSIAQEWGLREGVVVSYRAGDQPNNAMSLNVLHPGEVAATAGTSGVIYAVTDSNVVDEASRINTFLHVNDADKARRNGILICLNGAGILYSWLRRLFSREQTFSYQEMNALASSAPVGSDGLHFFPFGNGAERLLKNAPFHANVAGIDFNRHDATHLVRAGMEGIAYGMHLGFAILNDMDVACQTIRAGHANLFLSATFRSIFANVTKTVVELYDTDGADGAARGAAVGAGFFSDPAEAFASLALIEQVEPQAHLMSQYQSRVDEWNDRLDQLLSAENR